MEADNYLAGGYGLRLAIQARAAGWRTLGGFASVWQPSRLKGIQVGPDHGTPFLAATQVFDIRPVPRKWLSLDRTSDASGRLIQAGTIVVTCSGAVGRATLIHAPHEKILISHDLLRVSVEDSSQWGWVYAFLRSEQARSMMVSAKYGHMIKHLETSHLNALPVPIVRDDIARRFSEDTKEILRLRNQAYELALSAEAAFEEAVGHLVVKDWGEQGYLARASSTLFNGRRRFEGMFHNPGAASIRRHLAKNGDRFMSVRACGFNVWLPNRFKRIPAADGVELVESSSVFEINPDYEKRVAEVDFGDAYNGRVQAGWLLMARSGQTYGLNGNVAFATAAHEGRVVSDDLLRIAPNGKATIRSAYLFTALSHPRLGRPLVKAMAYGSSIPHIDGEDLLRLEIVRLARAKENIVADRAEEAAYLRAKADILECELALAASKLVDEFIAGDTTKFVSTVPAPRINVE